MSSQMCSRNDISIINLSRSFVAKALLAPAKLTNIDHINKKKLSGSQIKDRSMKNEKAIGGSEEQNPSEADDVFIAL